MSPRTAWQLIWLLCALPLADLVFRIAAQQLGANPQEAILRATGLWSLTLLLVTLGVTPFRQWLRWPELIPLRRMLGLWAFGYACIHLLAFWAFEHDFDLAGVAADAFKRPFDSRAAVVWAHAANGLDLQYRRNATPRPRMETATPCYLCNCTLGVRAFFSTSGRQEQLY